MVPHGEPPWVTEAVRQRTIAYALAAFAVSTVCPELSDHTRTQVLRLIWQSTVMTALLQCEITNLVDADLAGEYPELCKEYRRDIRLADDDWPPLWRFSRDRYNLLRAEGPLDVIAALATKVEGRG